MRSRLCECYFDAMNTPLTLLLKIPSYFVPAYVCLTCSAQKPELTTTSGCGCADGAIHRWSDGGHRMASLAKSPKDADKGGHIALGEYSDFPLL